MTGDAALLHLWSRAVAADATRRPLVLIELAPDPPGGDAEDLPIGVVNRALLEAFRLHFGNTLQATSQCASCSIVVEADIAVTDLLAAASGAMSPPVALTLEGGGSAVVRALTTTDLIAVERLEPGDAAVALLERCTTFDRPVNVDEQLRAQVDELLDAVDPLGDLSLAMTCPECAEQWSEAIDPADFVWAEVDIRARELMSTVHVLAATYGWSEGEVLSMDPFRRSMYVEWCSS